MGWVDSVFVISRLDSSTGATSEIMRLRWAYWNCNLGMASDSALWRGLATIDLLDLRAKRVSALRPRPTGVGIVADSVLAQSVVWLPQGNALLASTYSPGGLWRVELNGRATRLYLNRDYKNPWVGYPQLSPDGQKIALARLTAQTNAWLIEGLK
jgi:Tol biopolymer transport system component